MADSYSSPVRLGSATSFPTPFPPSYATQIKRHERFKSLRSDTVAMKLFNERRARLLAALERSRNPQSVLKNVDYGGQPGFNLFGFPAGQLTGTYAVQQVYLSGRVPSQGGSSYLYAPTITSAGCLEVGTAYTTVPNAIPAYYYVFDWCGGAGIEKDTATLSAEGYLFGSTYVEETIENSTASGAGSAAYLLHQPAIAGHVPYWVKVYGTTGTPSYAPTEAWDIFETHYAEAGDVCPSVPIVSSEDVKFYYNGAWLSARGTGFPGTVSWYFRSDPPRQQCIQDDGSGKGYYYVQSDQTNGWEVTSVPSTPAPTPSPPTPSPTPGYSWFCTQAVDNDPSSYGVGTGAGCTQEQGNAFTEMDSYYCIWTYYSTAPDPSAFYTISVGTPADPSYFNYVDKPVWWPQFYNRARQPSPAPTYGPGLNNGEPDCQAYNSGYYNGSGANPGPFCPSPPPHP